MSNPHEDKSKYCVKAHDKIKLMRDLGPEILAALLADPKTPEIILNSDSKSDYPLNQALLR
ncbi:MAG: hypothetical protein ACXW1W_14140 [Methylococcaceae bacterium]